MYRSLQLGLAATAQPFQIRDLIKYDHAVQSRIGGGPGHTVHSWYELLVTAGITIRQSVQRLGDRLHWEFGVRFPAGSEILLSSSACPCRLCNTPVSLLSSGCRGRFHRGKRCGTKLCIRFCQCRV